MIHTEKTHETAVRVINMMAVSVDGQIATSSVEGDGDRRAIGFDSSEDRRLLELELTKADAVIIGSSTAKAIGGMIELPSHKQPIWCLVTHKGFDGSEWFWHQTPKLNKIVYSPSCLNRLENVPNILAYIQLKADAGVASQIVEDLTARGCKRLLVLGGGQINKLFYQEKLIQTLKLTISPAILASETGVRFIQGFLPRPVLLDCLSFRVEANHIFLEYGIKNYL